MLRVHGHLLVTDLDGFVGLSGFEISHLHLLVNPADGFMLGSFRLELLHQRELLGVIGRLADLLEQLAFRRFGVDRAQLVALRQCGAGGKSERQSQDADSHIQSLLIFSEWYHIWLADVIYPLYAQESLVRRVLRASAGADVRLFAVLGSV